MLEVDIDDSGTVDFYEFLCVARLISQGKGKYKVSDRKNKRIQLFRKRSSYKGQCQKLLWAMVVFSTVG